MLSTIYLFFFDNKNTWILKQLRTRAKQDYNLLKFSLCVIRQLRIKRKIWIENFTNCSSSCDRNGVILRDD